MRAFIRKAFNRIGYDIHRQLKDTSPLFDIDVAAIRLATHAGTQAKFFVGDKRDAIQSHHDKGNFYETDILNLISDNFPTGGCFVDIGANVGNHSIFVAKHLNPSRVVAIEPMKLQHAILVVNVLLNDLQDIIDIHKIAASDRDGLAQMITPNPQNVGRSMISASAYGEWVQLARGDDLLGDNKVDFIKIDVEGHELSTLSGLERVISKRSPKLLVEVSDRNVENFREWVATHRYSIAECQRHHVENSEFLIIPMR